MTPEIPTHSFTFGKATITVRQEVGFDVSDSRVVYRKLVAAEAIDPADELDSERAWNDFIPAVVQTVGVEGELGFAWVTSRSSGAALAAAYAEFGKRARLVGGYRVALNAVEKLTPGSEPLDEKKEEPEPTPNATPSSASG